jgi:hypothetical protein
LFEFVAFKTGCAVWANNVKSGTYVSEEAKRFSRVRVKMAENTHVGGSYCGVRWPIPCKNL